MNTPQSLIDKADADPRVTIMEWKFERELEPLGAETVAAYVKVIQNEFCKLAHQTKCADLEMRERLLTHTPFRDFSVRYPTTFKKITTLEFAASPPLMSLVLYEITVLQSVQNGEISEATAKGYIAQATMSAMMADLKRRGIDPANIPAPGEAATRAGPADPADPNRDGAVEN